MSDTEDKKATPEKKKLTGTRLLTDGVYDTDFLDDQDKYTHYQFVNTKPGEVHNKIVMNIESGDKLPKDWILLDSQSTIDVFATKISLRKFVSISRQWISTVTPASPTQSSLANYKDTARSGKILQEL